MAIVFPAVYIKKIIIFNEDDGAQPSIVVKDNQPEASCFRFSVISRPISISKCAEGVPSVSIPRAHYRFVVFSNFTPRLEKSSLP